MNIYSKKSILIILILIFNLSNLIFSIFIHEKIHQFNYRDIEREYDRFCWWDCNIEGDGEYTIASYTILPLEEDYQKAIIIHNYTEYNAYIGQLLYIISINLLLWISLIYIFYTKTKDLNTLKLYK